MGSRLNVRICEITRRSQEDEAERDCSGPLTVGPKQRTQLWEQHIRDEVE